MTVDLQILKKVERAVYLSTGGEDEAACGSAVIYKSSAFWVSAKR